MAAHPVWGNGAIAPESRRQRDLLPLPLPPESAIASSRALSRATVAALNHLNAGFDSKPPRGAGRAAGATAAQHRSVVHVDVRAATFLATVGPACDQNASANFGPFEASAGKRGAVAPIRCRSAEKRWQLRSGEPRAGWALAASYEYGDRLWVCSHFRRAPSSPHGPLAACRSVCGTHRSRAGLRKARPLTNRTCWR